jgi:proprotein convertase subtilisin/kexin type 5
MDNFIKFDLNQCIHTCPKGYFNNSGVCNLCDPTCENCIGATSNQCTSCNETKSFFSSNSSCLEECPDSFDNYLNQFVCDPCDNSCKTCSGPSSF